MIFVDTHAHLYADEFDTDRDRVVRKAIDNGVTFMFLPNIDTTYFDRVSALSNQYPAHCFPMMGLHPTSVKENYRDELTRVAEELAAPGKKFYGIGEIGIDHHWSRNFDEEQAEAFLFQLDMGIKYDLPVVIHSRKAVDVIIDLLDRQKEQSRKGIFHCFDGSLEQAQKIISLGLMLGIGGIVTYKNSELPKVVKEVDLEHLCLETDCPWLPPVPHRGERNESAYIPLIAKKIAEIKHTTIENVARITTQNALTLFGL
ncbi:MAG: TatD family hydrolase [Bacteroidetes bacterium]|nr:TatD family hydrolase [Bacteroidota bacterium]